MSTILPSSVPNYRTPGAGRSFGAIIAAETLADAQAWIDQVGGAARTRRLGLLADMLLAANPEPTDTDVEAGSEAKVDSVVVDPDEAADMAVETVIQRLADEKKQAEREAELAAWTPAEAAAVERWSPFRSGPRYVTRSGRYGNGELATAGTAVLS
ncbi:hypothetical protein AB0O31_32900 [Kitasatospora cineracea]|uniref:hypothetical protein n=1 Tax=Kitasatospora cineracea TaxID=88074 RepID=UPI00341FBAA0